MQLGLTTAKRRTTHAVMFGKRKGPGPGQTREARGKRKRSVGFRLPDHLYEFVEAAEDAGYSKTEVVLRMMEVAADVSTELGLDWWEVEKMAGIEGVTPGTILGRLAKAALETSRKGRK